MSTSAAATASTTVGTSGPQQLPPLVHGKARRHRRTLLSVPDSTTDFLGVSISSNPPRKSPPVPYPGGLQGECGAGTSSKCRMDALGAYHVCYGPRARCVLTNGCVHLTVISRALAPNQVKHDPHEHHFQ